MVQTLPTSMPATDCTWSLIRCGDDTASQRRVTIHTLPFRVGRLPDAHLSLGDPSVSKQHAELWYEQMRWSVRDLGSTNGTFVNGRRILHDVPLSEGDLLQFASAVFRVAREHPQPQYHQTLRKIPDDWALAALRFDALLSESQVIPFFQPVIALADRRVLGYESLGRSLVEGLETPQRMFSVAAGLELECELSVLLREAGVREGCRLPGRPNLFLNTHPAEMQGPELLALLQKLRRNQPELPMTLEIHEGAVTDLHRMRDLRSALRDLQIQLAYDDFGAGQARIVELIEVPPDYLKFDMQLIRGIHRASSQRQQMLAALVHMLRDFGIAPLAEGVECSEEAATCQQLGFECAQGFFFGRPSPLDHYLGGTI